MNRLQTPRPPGLRRVRRVSLAGLCALAPLLLACASTPPPAAEMAVAESVLTHALNAGALEGAPMEMGMAREKMARARAATSAGHQELALTLVQQAQADARLAEAKTQAGKAAAALREDRRVLREEMDRKAPK